MKGKRIKSIKLICCATALCMTFICDGMMHPPHHLGTISELSAPSQQILGEVTTKLVTIVAKLGDTQLISRFLISLFQRKL